MALAKLETEPWGPRFKRARKQASRHHGRKITLDIAADHISRTGIKVAGSTLSRMEGLPEFPDTVHRQQIAVLACVYYGVDPTELDLSLAVLPPLLVRLGVDGLLNEMVGDTGFEPLTSRRPTPRRKHTRRDRTRPSGTSRSRRSPARV